MLSKDLVHGFLWILDLLVFVGLVGFGLLGCFGFCFLDFQRDCGFGIFNYRL